ncbi:MAG: sialate O-acetylesterase [Bacteroidaceae bacterium]|nr:sialate O-acetylesterase [Bacteroidaceae bacterium]
MKKLIFTLLLALPLMAIAQEKIKVACVGNSVTYGYGHKNPAETSYPTQLQQLLGEEYEVRNFGHSGATLLNKGHRPYTKLPEYKAALEFAPDIVVIHLGLNDTDPRNWPNYRDEFFGDYTGIIDSFRKAHPDGNPKIIVCRMTPIFHWHRRFKSGTRDWYWQIQEKIEEIAQHENLELVDLSRYLYSRPDLMPDALHPDAEGAAIIAKQVYQAITDDFGGLSLPAIYSDNMVVQQNKPFVVAGTADAGKEVVARFGKQKRVTTAAEDGSWKVMFTPMAADGEKYTITVECGKEKVKFKNVVIGEVWLCSGQSNMAFMVKESSHKAQSLANVKGKDIRLYDMKPRVFTDNIEWDSTSLAALNRHDYYRATEWLLQDEENVCDFSAVAYHFGAMLADSLGVPIGLICNAVGGAPAESFIDRKTLEFNPTLVDILYNWRENDMIQDWCRGRAAKNIAKSTDKLQRHPYEPCYLYETGIAPIACYPIKGAIWYQGESNAHNVELHETIFPTLVDCWRRTWNNPEMPFYFVQLSSIKRPSWPHFRDSQRRLAQDIPNCDFAVSSDKGHPTDVHPKEKAPVGERLARLALNQTYGMEHVAQHGPTPVRAFSFRGKTVIEFSDANKLMTSDGAPLRGLEIAGKTAGFTAVDFEKKATIKGNRIIIEGEAHRIRYAWRPFTDANLVNETGLPASTFEITVENKPKIRK